MKPPVCRFCGKEEWRHVCGGKPSATLKPRPEAVKPTDKRKAQRKGKR